MKPELMKECFRILEWDSRFFECTVAQVERNALAKENRDRCLEQLNEKDVRLAYYYSGDTLQNISNELYDVQLVLRKVAVKKDLAGDTDVHHNIEFYTEPVPNEELLDLAHRAGDWSRFSFDTNIGQGKVKKLYEQWMTKSVQKEMASEVLVYKEQGKILGMVTLKVERPGGQTPLFAVSREAEGRGISFALMRAVDAVLYEKGCSFYSSATQAENRAAVTVFKRHGCEIGPVEYVYHLWKK